MTNLTENNQKLIQATAYHTLFPYIEQKTIEQLLEGINTAMEFKSIQPMMFQSMMKNEKARNLYREQIITCLNAHEPHSYTLNDCSDFQIMKMVEKIKLPLKSLFNLLERSLIEMKFDVAEAIFVTIRFSSVEDLSSYKELIAKLSKQISSEQEQLSQMMTDLKFVLKI